MSDMGHAKQWQADAEAALARHVLRAWLDAGCPANIEVGHVLYLLLVDAANAGGYVAHLTEHS